MPGLTSVLVLPPVLLALIVAAPAASCPPTAAPTAAPTVVATAVRDGAESGVDLTDPRKKEIAMRIVSSAENSSLDWRAQYGYIEDIDDDRGYTAGIVGFCSGTGDMLDLVELYTKRKPRNVLAEYLPALRRVNGSDSHSGLGSKFVKAWKRAVKDRVFQRAQEDERDR
ncbi:chitosanase, partial [Sphaerimonospora thailandensis]|uniref:chitosanase n=1 Tax=Sphaerimonospora thailandensis TaxID=795644 RepID=UPI00194F1EF2